MIYDGPLVEAIRSFQQRHGLTATASSARRH
jgi:hypothetical protein